MATVELGGVYAKPMDVAAYLAISKTQVYRAIREGTIPSVRLGPTIRVPVGELLRCLEANVTAAGKVDL